MYIHTYTHTYIHAYIHTYIRTYIPTYIQAYYPCVCVCACVCVCVHKQGQPNCLRKQNLNQWHRAMDVQIKLPWDLLEKTSTHIS